MSKRSEYKEFDTFFKERYGKHELSPPSDIWRKVNSRINASDESAFDEFLKDRYRGHEIKPPAFLARKISSHNPAKKTNFLPKYLSPIVLGTTLILGIIVIYHLQTFFIDENEVVTEMPPVVNQNVSVSEDQATVLPSDNRLQKKNESSRPEEDTTLKLNNDGSILNESFKTEKTFNEDMITHKDDVIKPNEAKNDENKSKRESMTTINPPKERNKKYNAINEAVINNAIKNQEIIPSSQGRKNNNDPIESYVVGEMNIQIDTPQPYKSKGDYSDKVELTIEIPDARNVDVDTSKNITGSDNIRGNSVMAADRSERMVNTENEKKNELIADNNKSKMTNDMSGSANEDEMNVTIESDELVENIPIEKLPAHFTERDYKNLPTSTFERRDLNIMNIEKSESALDSTVNNSIVQLPSDTLTFESRVSRWSLAAYVAPAYSYLKLSGPDQGGISEFYNNNLNGSWNFSGSVKMAYHLNKKWSLNFGLGYNQLIQKLRFTDVNPEELPNISLDSENKTITVYGSFNTISAQSLEFFEFTNPNGDPQNPDNYGPINYREEYNFRFLTIPITARYLLGNKKLKGIFDAGLQASISISDKSLVHISAGSQREQTVTVDFKNYHEIIPFGLQFTAGAGLQYDLKDRFALLLLPAFNYSISNLNNTNYSSIKPWDINISSGVFYRF